MKWEFVKVSFCGERKFEDRKPLEEGDKQQQ